MAISYSTTGMLSKIKKLAAIPTNQPAFTDDALITILNDELQSTVAPFIISLNSDYFLTYKDFTIVSGKNEYRIPERATGNILYSVKYLQDENEYDVPITDLKNSRNDINYISYYIRGNYVHLTGKDSFSGFTLRMYYYRRTNNLIKEIECATIDSINGNNITFTSKPSTWTGSTKCDIVQNIPPFDTLAEDITVDLDGTSYTFSSVPDDLAVGNYLCLAGESPVAQIPWDAVQLLNQLAVLRVMESASDKDTYSIAQERYMKLEADITKILCPRVTSERKPIINNSSLA